MQHSYIDELSARIDDLRSIDYDRILSWTFESDTVFWGGNGGSALNASHISGELVKDCGIRSTCLTDSTHIVTAYSNDVSYEAALALTYENLRKPGAMSTVFVLSGSGNSANCVNLVRAARGHYDYVVCITGYEKRGFGNCWTHRNAMEKSLADYRLSTLINFGLDPEYPYSIQIAEDLQLIFGHILFRKALEKRKEGGV